MDKEEREVVLKLREADWEKLVVEIPVILELFGEQPQLAGPIRAMFDSAWVLGSRAGLKMAEDIMRAQI